MKTLLIITSDYEPNIGGIAVDTVRLFKLLKRKHSVDLAAFGINGDNSEGETFIDAKKIFFPYHLKKIISRKKYDAILVRTVLPLGWMLNLIKTEAKKIYFVYGQELLHDEKQKHFFRPSVRSIIKKSDRVVVNSKFTNSLIDNSGFLFYPLIENVECGERTERNFFKIITAGRFVKHKNFISMIRIIDRADAEVFKKTKKHVKLEIYGDGPLRKDYDDFIVRNNLSDNVSVCGRIESGKMNPVYASSDIIAMPSIKTNESVEGFGMVAQEAGLCGSVCIGYDSGGIRESIEDNELLADENDEEKLLNIIIRLLTDNNFYEAKQKFSRERAKKHLAGEERLKDFDEILSF
ncbi:MAG: glycosyltransferase family 4 protein [bacterium]|nr:glycosyltransferase family 4 protein [bacterium]